jgi:N-acetylglucosaminyl-diphospho-decaprenol L-rhamnosyltransferase
VKRREQKPVRVLVIIVNYKTAGLTIACLRSLEPQIAADPWIRVVVVENDSGDAEAIAAAITEHDWGSWASLVIAERNGGFSYGNNLGIKPALRWSEPPDYFLLLNPDTEVRGRAIQALVEYMDPRPEVGIAGSSFEYPDGSEWPIAFRFPTAWSEFEYGIRLGPISRLLKNRVVAREMGREPAEVDWVSGASMMVRREVIEDVGLMDEGYFLYFEEVDFCLRARRAGWPCWYVPQSRVMHIVGQSTGVSAQERKLDRMPPYWFASRSRYFVTNYGLTYARLADLAFGLGLTFWTVYRLLRRRRSSDPPGMLVDFWRTSVLFQSAGGVHRRFTRRSAAQ